MCFHKLKLPGTLLLFSLGYLGTLSSPAQSNLTNGLIAYFPFDGNAIDATGNGHDGVVKSATLTTNRFGQLQSAYAFNGTTSVVVVTNSSDLQPLSDLTVSVWAQVPSLPNGTFYLLFAKHSDTFNTSGWFMDLVPPSGGLPLQFQAAPYFDVNSPQANIPTNTWFQAVFTYQLSTRSCNLYINGLLADSRVRIYNTNSDPNPFTMGAESSSGTGTGYIYYFKGLLDDIRFYNRVLSGTEVQQLYTQESGPPAPPYITVNKALHFNFSSLSVGTNYQLQASTDLVSWSNVGTPFTATATTNSQYLDIGDWNSYWRLKTAP